MSDIVFGLVCLILIQAGTLVVFIAAWMYLRRENRHLRGYIDEFFKNATITGRIVDGEKSATQTATLTVEEVFDILERKSRDGKPGTMRAYAHVFGAFHARKPDIEAAIRGAEQPPQAGDE